MTSVFPKELFGHWIQDEEKAPEEERPKSQVDLRHFLNEPGALKQLVEFMNEVKKTEKKEQVAKNQKRNQRKKN